MRGIILLFYFFSSGIFFCTLSLFSLSYIGGGIEYSIYYLLLSSLVTIVVFVTSIKKLVQTNVKISFSQLLAITLFTILLISTIYGYYHFKTEPSLQILKYFLAFTTPAFIIAIFSNSKDLDSFYNYLKYLNIYLSICMIFTFVKTYGNGHLSEIGGASYLLIGYTMAFLFPYNFINFINQKSLLVKQMYGALIIFNVIIIFLSGSRGALISVCVTFLLMFYLYIIKTKKAFLYTISILIIIAITSVIFLMMNKDYNIAFLRISLLFHGDFGISSSGRDEYFEKALLQIQNSPLIGNGIGYYSNSIGRYTYPHNFVLEIANDFGAVGIIGLFIILIYSLIKSKSLIAGSPANQYLVFMLLQSLLMLTFSDSYLTSIQLWIPLTIILTFKKTLRNQQRLPFHRITSKKVLELFPKVN